MGPSRKVNPDGRMALGDHLREIRRRLLLAAVGILIGTVLGWYFYLDVYGALQAPFEALKERGQNADLNFGGGVASSFDMKIRISFFIGVILSSPWWIYQIWAFITPGLTKKERRVSLTVASAAVPLFLGGLASAWLVLPRAVSVLTMFTPEKAVIFIDATIYMKFVTQFMLAFGIAYLMPLFMTVLSALGIVSGRTWLKGWRWAIILVFVFSAAASPTPDVTTMALMAGPMFVLYMMAVGISLLFDRRLAKRRAATDAALAEFEAAEQARKAAEAATSDAELEAQRAQRAYREMLAAHQSQVAADEVTS